MQQKSSIIKDYLKAGLLVLVIIAVLILGFFSENIYVIFSLYASSIIFSTYALHFLRPYDLHLSETKLIIRRLAFKVLLTIIALSTIFRIVISLQ